MRSLSVRKDICDIELAKLVPRSSDLLTSPHFSTRAQQFCFHFLFSFSFCFSVFIFVFIFYLFLLSTFCYRRVVITSQHPFFNTCAYSRSHNITSGAFRSFKICGHFHFHNFSSGVIWLFKNYAHLHCH